jgi:hypothetical protein
MRRYFVQLDGDGNVSATLDSERPPGSDPAVIPSGHIEVSEIDETDWFRMKWNGAEFVERDDLETP